MKTKIYRDIGTKYAWQGKTETELLEYISDAPEEDQKIAIDAYNEIGKEESMIIQMTSEADQILGCYKAGFDNKKIASMLKMTIEKVDFILEQLKVFAFID